MAEHHPTDNEDPAPVRPVPEPHQELEARRAQVYSKWMLEAVIHGSPIPQFVIDRGHHVLFWNRALEQISGVKAA